MTMPEPVHCDKCGELSVVRSARYEFKQPNEVHPGQEKLPDLIVTEVRYVIVCAKCGEREQTARPEQ